MNYFIPTFISFILHFIYMPSSLHPKKILHILSLSLLLLSSFLFHIPSVLASAPTNGLVGYWKFDETSGTTASDSSGNGLTATLSGGSFVAGNIGNALSLNGSTNYADVGNPAFSVMVPFSLPKLTPVSMSNSVNTILLWGGGE